MTIVITGKQLKPGMCIALSIWAGKIRHFVELAVLPPADHTLVLQLGKLGIHLAKQQQTQSNIKRRSGI